MPSINIQCPPNNVTVSAAFGFSCCGDYTLDFAIPPQDVLTEMPTRVKIRYKQQNDTSTTDTGLMSIPRPLTSRTWDHYVPGMALNGTYIDITAILCNDAGTDLYYSATRRLAIAYITFPTPCLCPALEAPSGPLKPECDKST